MNIGGTAKKKKNPCDWKGATLLHLKKQCFAVVIFLFFSYGSCCLVKLGCGLLPFPCDLLTLVC